MSETLTARPTPVQPETGKEEAHLLLVDDDAAYLALCVRYLSKDREFDYRMVTVSCAEEALAACVDTRFDCLLVDYELPEGTGTDLVATLRERFGKDELSPVVFISAETSTDAVIAAVRNDAVDFLSKRQVSAGSLCRSIGNAVEKGRLKYAILTRQRALENANRELERRAVEIQRFYHTVSHEMKTPLTAAREFVAIVKDGLTGEINPEQEELLAHALECCDQITTQFNDLIDLTRLETGKMRLVREPSDFEGTVARAVAMNSKPASDKSLTLESEVEAGLPPLDIDSGRIVQVLSNLLGNAIKFTPDGGRVRLEAHRADDGHTVKVDVIDSGCGISESDCAKVFDRLYQVSIAADNLEGSGLGLGLSIAREIIRGHGEELAVTSRVGVGSTFSFALPIAVERPDVPCSSPHAETLIR